MESSAIEKIQLIGKKVFIQVIQIGTTKKTIPMLNALSVPMEKIVIEQIQPISKNSTIVDHEFRWRKQNQPRKNVVLIIVTMRTMTMMMACLMNMTLMIVSLMMTVLTIVFVLIEQVSFSLLMTRVQFIFVSSVWLQAWCWLATTSKSSYGRWRRWRWWWW